MKIQVLCEKCGKIVELKPVTRGQHAYVNSNLINKGFYVSDIDIECSGNIEEDVTDFDDLDIDKKLNEVRIDCQNCGDYIVLTEFGQ